MLQQLCAVVTSAGVTMDGCKERAMNKIFFTLALIAILVPLAVTQDGKVPLV
jgi:hypothetical protein